MEQQILERYLQIYETIIGEISRRYYWPNRNTGAFDLEDLEQAGRTAIFNISRKRPEKLDTRNYVCAAIKYSIFNEMKKMRHREKHVYLVTEDETIPLVDVFPTKEKGNKFDESEDLLYHIKNEFSKEDAEGLERLLENCENIYGLNLNEPPSTDTKDRVRVVTKMDLNDEEMLIYARVLLGDLGRFPSRYPFGDEGKRRAHKFMSRVLEALGKSPKDFLKMRDKTKIVEKYSLMAFYRNAYDSSLLDFMRDFDSSLAQQDIVLRRNHLPESKIQEIVDSHERFDANATLAAKSLGCSPVSVTKYWRLHSLAIREYGDGSIQKREISKIVDSHGCFDGNTAKAAEQLGRSPMTVQRYWKEAGLHSINEGKNVKKSEKEIKEIMEAHGLYNGNASEAARHLGYNYNTILRHWRKQGFEANPPGHPIEVPRREKRRYWLIRS